MRQFLIFATVFCASVIAAKYPKDLPRCRAGDVACLPKVITDIIRSNPNGHAGLSVPVLEPLRILKIDISQGGSSPIAINLNFKNLDLFGISRAVVNRVVGFDVNPKTSKYEVYANIPKLTVSGDYKINGRVLVLPIQGNGTANLVFENVDMWVKYKPKVIVKKGKDYIQTEKFELGFDTTRLRINLSNLFNGDKALGDNMNQFLNDNWHDILKELKPSISYAIEEILKGIINRIFAKLPYESLFLPN